MGHSSDYQSRKLARTVRYQEQHGRKLIRCSACSGSGVYDHTGSPPCGGCDGIGKVRERLPTPPVPPVHWRERLAQQRQRRQA